jgi:hypothetical protein
MSRSLINEMSAFQPLPGQDTLHDKMTKPGNGVQSVPSTSGVSQTLTPRKHLTFRESLNNSTISHMDAYIVLGGDRPGHIGTGEGASGFISDSIDLVVGRGANLNDGKGLPDGYIVGPMFTSDAARIYISRSTHIDKNFGIARVFRDSQFGSNKQPVSGIGIKADRVRMIARDNIKIVTGMADGFTGQGGKEKNALGGKVGQAGTISLIGGNYTAEEVKYMGIFNPGGPIASIPYLQPAIKGDYLANCLEDLFSYVDLIEACVFNLVLSDMGADAVRAAATLGPIEKTMRGKYLTYGGPQHIRSSNVYLT